MGVVIRVREAVKQLEVLDDEVAAVIETYYPNAKFSASPCVPSPTKLALRSESR